MTTGAQWRIFGRLARVPPVAATTLILIATLYIAATQNDALWALAVRTITQPLDFNGAMIFITLAAILVAGTFTVAAVLCIGWMTRPVLVVLLVVAVICNYFMSRFGVLIDQQMIANATVTNTREAGELMTSSLILRVILWALVPAAILYMIPIRRRPAIRDLLIRSAMALLLWAIAAAVLFSNYKESALWARTNSEVRKYPNPVYPLSSALKLLRSSVISPASAAEFRTVAKTVEERPADGRRRVVILVVGETARADHFSLYGYDRNTNPRLANIPDLLRFSNVKSCGTSTAVSVPCMFSRGGQDDFDRNQANHTENLIDIAERANVDVVWRDNNTGCQGVCSRTNFESVADAEDSRFCKDGLCRDEILLEGLQERIYGGRQDQLIVLHQLGSHGPSYYKRYPPSMAAFKPECAVDDAYRCERQSLVNSYDNTILYTDFVLSRIIDMIQGMDDVADIAMLYISDHGESLGENGMYLHGFPYALAPDAQIQVPMLAWLNPSLSDRLRVDSACLRGQSEKPISHDNLFDTVLGLLDIRTDVYRAQDDVIGQCRGGV